ncbi:MAG: ABC-type transporter, integral rane subunit, partial [candidate division NC10 bacterium]|nr:ABC-type transporter, integral rane subunit [candidate division NC10 bacterium]
MTAYRRETIFWAAFTLGAFVLLPWERVGKAFLAWSWSATGLALAPTAWPLVSAGLAAALAGVIGVCGRGARRAGGALLAVSLVGALAALYQLAVAGRAFGLGGLACLLGLLTLVGIGLAQTGFVRGGAFVAAAILWTAGLIVIFILFPLLSMLQASVIIQGHLTTTGLRRYLTSPIFLLLRHPELPTDPIRWGIGLGSAVGAAVLTAVRLARQR